MSCQNQNDSSKRLLNDRYAVALALFLSASLFSANALPQSAICLDIPVHEHFVCKRCLFQYSTYCNTNHGTH